MSAGHDDGSSLIAIGMGTLIPTGLAAVAGALAATAFWPLPDPNSTGLGATFGNLFAGLFVGAVMGFFVGWFMSWNAYVMGCLHERSPMAAAWGVIPGLVFGASLGPFFGGTAGVLFGHLVSGALFGLYLGPVVGVLAWQIGFFLANMFHPQHD